MFAQRTTGMVIGKQIPVGIPSKPLTFPKNPFNPDTNTNKNPSSASGSIQFQGTPRVKPRARIEPTTQTPKGKGKEGKRVPQEHRNTTEKKKAKGDTTGIRMTGMGRGIIGDGREKQKKIHNPEHFTTRKTYNTSKPPGNYSFKRQSLIFPYK